MGCDILAPMNHHREHAHSGDLHLEVWVVDDRAFWRVENLRTHEQVKTDESKDVKTAKAQACAAAKVDHIDWKAIG
jgi:hypothetical protein